MFGLTRCSDAAWEGGLGLPAPGAARLPATGCLAQAAVEGMGGDAVKTPSSARRSLVYDPNHADPRAKHEKGGCTAEQRNG